MKISHRNVPYSDIPRLVQEGVIKVGTRVKACDDIEKYPNECGILKSESIELITRINDDYFWIERCNHSFKENGFLDILSDEGEEGVLTHSEIGKGVKSKPLSFDEPLTKEAVGRVIVNDDGMRRRIIQISPMGECIVVSDPLDSDTPLHNSGWWPIYEMRPYWHFESSPDEITVEEAEKLTGKKIKR